MPINWQKLLSVPELLLLLERIVERNIESILPSLDQRGEIVYPSMGEIPSSKAVSLLEQLTSEGVLGHSSETRLLGCPIHEDSLDLSARVKCPHCSSMLLKKGTLLQHNCGFIGNLEAFSATCPKCGKPSSSQTLKTMGNWYECGNCKQRSAAPNVFLYCKKFDHDFPIQNAQLVDKPSYKLSPEAAKDLKERIGLMISLKRGIESGGRGAEVFGSIMGASGVQHTFDLVVQGDDIKIPIDIKLATDAPVGVASVLATYAKALDTKSKPSVLIAVPSAAEDAKRSAQAYGMLIVEGADSKSILSTLSLALGAARADPPQVVPNTP